MMQINPNITKSLGEACCTIVHDSTKGMMPPKTVTFKRGEYYDRKTKPA